MAKDTPLKTWEWLQTGPKLTALCEAYPQEWASVQAELAGAIERNQAEELKALATRAAATARAERLLLIGKTGGRIPESALLKQVRAQMTDLAIRQYSLAAATGVREGKVRFDLVNGFLAQRLFFEKGLTRRPVSLFWFRLIWPLLWQKRRLMPLVESRGIYCFFSAALIKALAQLIGERRCLEIAAGDGTLSRFLTDAGVTITASDDGSWNKAIKYPDSVLRLDAREALQRYAPKVVICCWPPARNGFEKQVFKTRSVELYLLIASRQRYVCGNWDDYEQQSHFEFTEDPALSRLVLPPELDAAVYVFRRKSIPPS